MTALPSSLKYLAATLLIVSLGTAACYTVLRQPVAQHSWPTVDADDATGLRPVDCWFGEGLEPVECYQMQVPERRGEATSRMITFPVVVFRHAAELERSPMLMLGAGGPGAPMALDDAEAMRNMVESLAMASLRQGRDLVVIDPRGAGLARPLLTCESFVDGERKRLRQNLSLRDEIVSVTADYQRCIDDLIATGIDLGTYHSFTIAHDIEALRRAAGIERWVLLGVSYAANYALTVADEFPGTVESMVLDSAFVSRVPLHQRYIEQTTRPFRLLYNYCRYDPGCSNSIEDVRARFWGLHARLNAAPVSLELELGDGRGRTPVALNGERFIATILNGTYDLQIYRDLPWIIGELERGEFTTFEPYLWAYVDYLLDPVWGDVSGMAHYCYEEKPFIDFARIRELIEQLPAGYLRETAPLFLDWPDHCAQMRITSVAPRLVPSRRLETPVLFLHGELDVVTPLSSVRRIQRYFDHSRLVRFDLAHGILGASDCARLLVSRFVHDPNTPRRQLEC